VKTKLLTFKPICL